MSTCGFSCPRHVRRGFLGDRPQPLSFRRGFGGEEQPAQLSGSQMVLLWVSDHFITLTLSLWGGGRQSPGGKSFHPAPDVNHPFQGTEDTNKVDLSPPDSTLDQNVLSSASGTRGVSWENLTNQRQESWGPPSPLPHSLLLLHSVPFLALKCREMRNPPLMFHWGCLPGSCRASHSGKGVNKEALPSSLLPTGAPAPSLPLPHTSPPPRRPPTRECTAAPARCLPGGIRAVDFVDTHRGHAHCRLRSCALTG